MLKFARHKTVAEIVIQCKAQGVYLDRAEYDKGADTICVGSPVRHGSGWAIFNTFNGRFWGQTQSGVEFTSDSAAHDSEPWMQSLLQFFMASLNDEAPGKRPATAVDYTLGGIPLLDLS